MKEQNPVDRMVVYICAGLISGAGALIFSIMPVFLGAAADTYLLNDVQIGNLAASFNLGFTVFVAAGVAWFYRLSWRMIALIGSAITLSSLISMILFGGYNSLLILMTFTGGGMAILYALAMEVFGTSDFPDRAFGIKLGIETLPAAILLFILPVLMLSYGRFEYVVLVVALTVFVTVIPAFGLPPRHHPIRRAVRTKNLTRRFSKPALVSLIPSIVFFTGISASWVFLERIAIIGGLPTKYATFILATGFTLCAIGGFIAAAIGQRWGRYIPIILIVVSNIVGLFLLTKLSSPLFFAIGTYLFLLSVNYTLAYFFGFTAELDEDGSLVILCAISLSVGGMIGPFIAGHIVLYNDYSRALIFSGFCTILAFLIYIVLVKKYAPPP